MNRTIKLALASAVAAVGLGAFLAPSASASSVPNITTGCAARVFCGGQTLEAGNLAMSVTSLHPALNSPVVVDFHANSPMQDFYQYNPNGDPANNKAFEYAPNGVRSHLCISQPVAKTKTKIVLRHCNGSLFQTFVASQVDDNGYVDWINQNSHLALTDPFGGPAGTTLQGRTLRFQVEPGLQNAATNQAWRFDTDDSPVTS